MLWGQWCGKLVSTEMLGMSMKALLRSSSGLGHFDNIPGNCLGLKLGEETRCRLGLHTAELVQVKRTSRAALKPGQLRMERRQKEG